MPSSLEASTGAPTAAAATTRDASTARLLSHAVLPLHGPCRTALPGLCRYYAGCNDDPREVFLGNLEVGSKGVPAVLEVIECALDVGLAQGPVKADLVEVQVTGVGLHQPGQGWQGP